MTVPAIADAATMALARSALSVMLIAIATPPSAARRPMPTLPDAIMTA